MANERLGVMIAKHEKLEHIPGVVKAARTSGHPVMIFMTDEGGVKFTQDPKFLELLKVGGVDISVCDHSCERSGIHDKAEGVSYGSQYNSAGMLQDCPRVLVF